MRIGIDLGGTKIEAVALTRDGSERFRQRVPTPTGNYGATVRAIADLVRAALADADRLRDLPDARIGIARDAEKDVSVRGE